MKRTILLSTSAICTAIAGAMLLSPATAEKLPLYDPYPDDILAPNVRPEIHRVQREIRGIFQQYLLQLQQVGPLTVAGNPPTIQGNGYEAQRILGGLLNYDLNMSPLRNVACASCHMPYAGFSGPIPSVNLTMVAYPGSYHYRAGKRTAQRYTYSPYFPVLSYDTTQGAFFGGNFWDGRSTGYLLQSPDAEQAQHPPVDTQEMANPDTACIAYKLSLAEYRPLFEAIWGAGSLDIQFPANTADICSTPGGAAIFNGSATPVALSSDDRTKANDVFDHWGQSISFLEHSTDISPFTSKIDANLKGNYTYTADEAAGATLFRGKGNCNSCHLDGTTTTLTPTQTDTGTPANTTPLFTGFCYADLGLPLNPRDAFYYQTVPDSLGFTANPYGFGYRDLGLGTFLRSGFGAAPNPNSEWVQFAPASDGLMQTSTIRNVAMTPPQCPTTEAPGPYFQKEFFHNGYIKSLKQLVHFYNTRDVYPYNVTSGHCPEGTTEKVDCWPMPEVPGNMDMTIGNLLMTDEEENQVVAILQAATDGFTTPYPFSDTFTGQCLTGGSASTQGNETLIATPELPPCASVVCDVPPVPSPPIQ
jgi:cytochrome c peroxidase